MVEETREENPCPSQTMAEWLSGSSEGECRPCLLAPVVQWYESELRERGLEDMAENLVDIATKAPPEEVAAALDKVKENADPELAARLKEFDCAAQSFSGSDEELAFLESSPPRGHS